VVLCLNGLKRSRTYELQRAGNRGAEVGLVEPDAFLRSVQQVSQPIDLLPKEILPFARGFEFLLDRPPILGFQIGRFDFSRHLSDILAPDSAAHRLRQFGIDDLGKAAQLLPDCLGLVNKYLQNAILRTLLVDEVMTKHERRELELAIDPAIALFHAA